MVQTRICVCGGQGGRGDFEHSVKFSHNLVWGLSGADLWCCCPWSTNRLHSPPVWVPRASALCLNAQKKWDTADVNAERLPSPALWPPFPIILASVPLDILEHYRGSQRLLVDREWHLLRFSGLDVNTKAWKCSQIVEFLKIKKQNILSISLVVQWLRLHLPMQVMWVRFLVGELRSCMPCSQKQKKERMKQKQHCSKFNKDLKEWSTSKISSKIL